MRVLAYAGGLTPADQLAGLHTIVFRDMRGLPQLLDRFATTELPGQSLVVDDQHSLVREQAQEAGRCTYRYDWLTGPDAGYGFGSSGPERSTDDHIAAVRDFLADVDPRTGHQSQS